ncbi:MAG: chromosome segregation protein SMC, partial [Deltaproteobacteria bacterium HGW-Deltaproteobacteria-17]
MRLARLEINGFKSFASRTLLELPDGLNAIVGPNGCGKSNVVDAIRWVLGEQSARSLRGRVMEDVIFSGSQNRAPAGLAEVTLVFEQDDRSPPPVAYMQYPEIRVSRVLHRDGTSEYRMMNMPCRLKDIVDVFSGTGLGSRSYAIIEQGKIAYLIAARPDERRMLFEEAAQISRYRTRRKESEKRLEESRHHLERIGDIVRELGTRLNQLERQKAVAQRFQILEKRIFILERWRAVHQGRELQAQIERARAQQTAMGEKILLLQNELEIVRTGAEGLQLQKAEAETAYMETVDRLIQLEKQLAELTGSVRIGQNQLVSLEKAIATAHQRKVESQTKLESTQKLVDQSVEKALHLVSVAGIKNEELAQLDQEFKTARNARLDLDARVQDLRNEVLQLEKQISAQTAMAESEARQRVENEARRVAFVSEVARMREQQAQLAPQLEACLAARDGAEKRYRELEAALKALEAAVHADTEAGRDLQNQLMTAEKEDSSLSGKLAYLQDVIAHHQDADESARRLWSTLEKAGHVDWVEGSLLDAFSPEESAVAPLELILSRATHAFRLSGTQRLADLLRLAGESDCADVGLMLPQAEAEAPAPHLPEGWIPLTDRVRCLDGRFSRWIARWWFAPSLEAAIDHLHLIPDDGGFIVSDTVLVTGNGEVWLHRRSAKSAFRIRLEKDRLEPQAQAAAARRAELAQAVAEASGRVQTATAGLRDLRVQLRDAQTALSGELVTENKLRAQLGTLEQVIADREQAIARLAVPAEAPRPHLDPELERKARAKREQLTAGLEKLREMAQRADGLNEQVQNVRVAAEGWKQKIESEQRLQKRLEEELEVARTTVEDAQSTIDSGHVRIRELTEETAMFQEQLAAQQEILGQAKAQLDAKRQEKERLTALWDSESDKIRKLERQISPLTNRRNELDNELARLDGSLAYLVSDFADNFPMERLDNLMDQEEYRERFGDAQKAERDEVMQEMGGLRGDYNPNAIHEHEETLERHTQISAQFKDLEKAVADLEKAVLNITEQSRERFLASFAGISERFSTLFPRLFGGGTAQLRLGDGDPLETGVDILVQLPGKRMQAMELLSGGEKAMTAIALLFSLFLFRPSPLCVLDEVDAPLDEANVDKYNALLREMSRTTQFLVITHNRR